MALTIIHALSPFGEPYRKTLQYGFCLQQEVDWLLGQKLNSLGYDPMRKRRRNECCIDMYACGFLPPHFPVPAIPIEVSWWDADLGYVDLFVGHDPCVHIEFKG